MENKRSALFDNVRFLLICLVVIGHFVELYLARSNAYQSIVIFIYSFHMPLFLFVAGLFYKDKDTTAKAVAYICIGYLLKMILALEKQLISGQFVFSLLSEEYIPWYMFALAFYIVISHVLRNVDKRLLLIMSVLLSCFAGYDDTVGVFLTLSRIIVFYPFFLLGQMCSYEGLAALCRKPALRVTGAAVLIAWAAACVLLREKLFPLRPLLLGRHPYSVSEEFLPWGVFTGSFAMRWRCRSALRSYASRRRAGCRWSRRWDSGHYRSFSGTGRSCGCSIPLWALEGP